MFCNGFCSILIMLLFQYHWLSIKFTTGSPVSLHSLWLFWCWLGQSLWSFYGRVSLNSVFPLLQINFVGGLRLELMYISHILSIRSSFTHLHGFQLLVLLPKFIEIPFFVCTNRINLLNVKSSVYRLVIIAIGLLKLPNLYMLIKQESITFQKLGTFGNSHND